MPTNDDQEALERAREDAREGKSPSTQAGEFVREEIDHVREGKHGADMRKARMYMCAMQALCGTTLPSASGHSAFCVAAGFKDAPNRFC